MNILITGGASGLGKAITLHLLAEQEHQIFFTFRNSETAANLIETTYSNTEKWKCNFCVDEDLASLETKMIEWDIDVLINNAFTGLTKKHFHKSDVSNIENSFSQNILPTLRVTQQAIRIFRKKKFGKIITILSSAIQGNPPIGWSAYVAEKNFLLSMSKSWAVENIKSNITANCISPSYMQTPLNKDTDERIVEEMVRQHPLKKLLNVAEVASLVGFFVDATQQVNGENLIVNAGNS